MIYLVVFRPIEMIYQRQSHSRNPLQKASNSPNLSILIKKDLLFLLLLSQNWVVVGRAGGRL